MTALAQTSSARLQRGRPRAGGKRPEARPASRGFRTIPPGQGGNSAGRIVQRTAAGPSPRAGGKHAGCHGWCGCGRPGPPGRGETENVLLSWASGADHPPGQGGNRRRWQRVPTAPLTMRSSGCILSLIMSSKAAIQTRSGRPNDKPQSEDLQAYADRLSRLICEGLSKPPEQEPAKQATAGQEQAR